MTRLLVVAAAAAVLVSATPRGAANDRAEATARIDSIASPAGPGSTTPNFAVAANGRVYMSWLEPSADSSYSLRFATYSAGRWSAARTIAKSREFMVNWADFQSIEVLGTNHLAAHWLQRGRGPGAYGIRLVQSRDDGATWSAAVTPHRDSTSTEHGFVAMWRESGRFGAAWLDGRRYEKGTATSTDEMMLIASTVATDGSLSSETVLDARVCDCCQTSAANTSAGPIIAFRDRSPDEIRDISVVRRINGKWSAPTAVSKDGWKIAACPVNGPAIDASGARVALAWFTAARDTAHVKVAFSSNSGAAFGRPVIVDSGNPAGRVDTRLLPDGSALVTWIERTGGDAAEVRVRRITASGKAGAPFTVATSSAARASGFPRMAITRDQAIFAWTVPGRPSSIRVARAQLSELR